MKYKIENITVSFHTELLPDGDLQRVKLSQNKNVIHLTKEQAISLSEYLLLKFKNKKLTKFL